MLTILYGTETGTAADVAERIGHEAVWRNLRPKVLPMDALPLDAWASAGPLVLVCATTGQGDAPATMRATWRALRRRDCPSLAGVKYAVFGLGDGTYARFNWVAKMVHNRIAAVGGTAMFSRVLGDEQHRRGIDGALDEFLQCLWPALGCVEPQLPTTYEPRWQLQLLEQPNPIPASTVLRDRAVSPVTVAKVERATAADHFQDARVLTLDMGADAGTYAPGDTVEVFPPNLPAQVAAALHALGLQPDAVVRIVHNPACGRNGQETPYFFERPMTARELLTQFLDVQRTVPRHFMFVLAQWYATRSAEARERLLELARGPLDDFFDYAIRERRTVWEVLEDFATMLDPIPPSVLVSMLRPAIPREFSIASASATPGRVSGLVDLLVGRQTFTSPMGRVRVGVCSNYLCDAQEGGTVMARLSRGVHAFTLPPDPTIPIIAVGPGTGIAPIRALMWELVQRRWAAPICLVTGHRDRSKDYFFSDDWEALKRAHAGVFRHLAAFSREGRSGAPRYVQHALTHDAATKGFVGALLLDGAWIYLCGNSKQMPRDVQRALAECVVAAVGQATDEESIASASAELDKKRTAGEFQMDTWGG